MKDKKHYEELIRYFEAADPHIAEALRIIEENLK